VSVPLLATTTTIGGSRTTTTYPGTVTLSGTVTQRGTSTRLGGGLVTVRSRPAGGRVWSTVKTVRADAKGAWKFAIRPTRNTVYQGILPAGTGRWAGTSNRLLSLKSAPRVVASLRATTIKRGQTATVNVAVQPGRAVGVELQRKVGSRWVVVQRKTTNRSGKATMTHRATARGRFAYRVVTRADTTNAAGTSVARTLTVR
jgi:hypothetical protein